MNILSKIKSNITTLRFNSGLRKLVEQGKVRPFDVEFLSQFDGKYWHGLPIYYYLTKDMANKKCYDASCSLGLAMGDGAYIMRGDLQSQEGLWKGNTGHGWVETDTHVFDTTWQMIFKKEDYYKVFRPKVYSKTDYNKFKTGIKQITDPEIRDKKWYEENPTFANILIFTVRELEMQKLENKNLNKEEKEFSEKVLNDLPNVSLREYNEFIDKELKELSDNWEM